MREAAQKSFDVALGATCILLLAFSLFVGCSPDVVGVSGEEDDHEAEHYVPPHFPKDAVAAIERLQKLCDPNAEQATNTGSDVEVTPRKEVYDLARWLPELAAETELDEPTWNVVRDASLVLQKAADGDDGDAAPTGAEVAAAIKRLAPIPKAIHDAELADRRKRGLDGPAELVIDAAKEEGAPTTGPES